MDWQRLCTQLNLGDLLATPTPLTGGLMHKMYRLDTTTGRYATKWLNPHIMRRPDAHHNFRQAEILEQKLEQAGLAILPALTIGGKKMQEIDGQFVYVFPYFDGVALTDKPITPRHCEQVGSLLAGIHNVDRREGIPSRAPLSLDWDALIRQATGNEAVHSLLVANREMLWEMQQQANRALPHLPAEIAICHNDMDPKNVLWREGECRAIDLECLGYDSPGLELLETALCGAGYESGQVDYARLTAFLRGYVAAGGILSTDWETLYHSNAGRLEWLAYNLRRALGEEGDDARQLGMTEVEKTLVCISGYYRMKDHLLFALESI